MASALIIVFKLGIWSFYFLTNDSGNAESCAPLSIKAKYGSPSILTKVSFAGPINLAIGSGLWYSLRITLLLRLVSGIQILGMRPRCLVLGWGGRLPCYPSPSVV